MRHRATPRFWEHYRRLPTDVRDLADKNFQLLQSNPRHSSLRVGLAHRALAVEDGEDFLWVWIGSHDDYDRLLRGR
jgi:hypothetical protein